ncbi:hypothetical protein [Corynebacterium sp. H130]|uniref:hypothetical protein n=1 Tax=Corynebacterium sp. H130 TaxID=3133444 RepID=UPI0030AE2A86
MLRRVGEAEPLPERYLPIFLGVLAVLFTVVPLVFVSLVFFGTHPGAIPGLRSAEKKLAPELEQNIGALPAGFHAETNIMVAGGVSISARGQGTVAQGADTHRVLLDAIDRTDTGKTKIAAETTVLIGESMVTIAGQDRANLEAMTPLAGTLVDPALQVRMTLDEPKLLVRAAHQTTESIDSVHSTAGPCAASRAEFISHISEIAALDEQGIPVVGDFMHCADSVPGAYFGEHVSPQAAKDLDRLLNSQLGGTVFWAKVGDNGNINVRFKSGSETAEAQWKEKWPHGEVKVFKV